MEMKVHTFLCKSLPRFLGLVMIKPGNRPSKKGRFPHLEGLWYTLRCTLDPSSSRLFSITVKRCPARKAHGGAVHGEDHHRATAEMTSQVHFAFRTAAQPHCTYCPDSNQPLYCQSALMPGLPFAPPPIPTL